MRCLPILSIIAFVTFIRHGAASDPASFWSGYPSCAVNNCFVPLSINSSCELNDNLCVCTNATFISSIAVCLGQKCPDLGDSVYSQYQSACSSNGGYTFALSKLQFLTESKTLTKVLQSFWGGYPQCAATSCLVPLTASSGCEIDDNDCVCTNGTLVSAMARCVGQYCSSVSAGLYSLFSSSCLLNGGYTIALSESQWNQESNVAAPSSSSQTPVLSSMSNQQSATSTFSRADTTVQTLESTTTSTTQGTTTNAATSTTTSTTQGTTTNAATSTSSNPTNTPSSSGYTKDQAIALGVGIGIGLPTFLIGLISLCMKCRR
jgi:hypothetical protein